MTQQNRSRLARVEERIHLWTGDGWENVSITNYSATLILERSIGTISLNLVQEERRKREKGRFHKEEHKGIASIVTDRTESWYT